MLAAVNSNTSQIGNYLLGLIDYYEIIFEDDSLIASEGEFRNVKLGLILDLINTVRVPDDLMMELKSAIIAAWRLRHLRSTREYRSEEMCMILGRMEKIRSAIELMRKHQDPILWRQLDIAVLHALPLRCLDLESEDVGKVQYLLDQAIEYLDSRAETQYIVDEHRI